MIYRDMNNYISLCKIIYNVYFLHVSNIKRCDGSASLSGSLVLVARDACLHKLCKKASTAEVHAIEIETTAGEFGALLLEMQRIKQCGLIDQTCTRGVHK